MPRAIELRRDSAALLAAVILVVGAFGCAAPSEQDSAPPPLILISIDTLRSDHLPAYGYTKIATPALERLRRDGILFENAYANAPLTFPSHSSMLTGLLPNAHGVRDNLGYKLASERLPYLPRILREQGYATGAAVSAQSLNGSLGLADGFDLYDDDVESEGARGVGQAQRRGTETLKRAIAWLDGLRGPQFFLFLHLYEPHTPYEPPEPYASLYPSPYNGEIAAADAVVGALLEALDERQLYEPAAILLVSDHGEGLGDHGELEHGILLYRETLQVPMILKLPRSKRAGSRVATPAQLVDVSPTLAELGGAAPAAQPGAGVSLLSLVERAPATERPIFAETFYPRLQYGWSDLGSVVVGPLHMIEGVERELYDLAADPGEHADVVHARSADADRVGRALASYDRTFVPRGEEDPDIRKQLQALGYLIGGSSPGTGQLGDPKVLIHTLEDLMTGMGAFRRGDYPTAERALRLALEQHPQLVDTWVCLARSIVAQGRKQEALEVYRQAFARTVGSPILAEDAVRVFVELGRAGEAQRLISAALERDPDRRDLQSLQVRLLLQTGQVEEANRRAEAAVARYPDDAGAWYDLSLVARVAGNLSTSERALRRTVALEPGHVNALNDLAVLVASRGELDEAIALAREVLRVSPGHALATENLQTFEDHRRRIGTPPPVRR
jgi:choline-sulfatase